MTNEQLVIIIMIFKLKALVAVQVTTWRERGHIVAAQLVIFNKNAKNSSNKLSYMYVKIQELQVILVFQVHMIFYITRYMTLVTTALLELYGSMCKTPVKSSSPTNQHQTFLQAGWPSCRPTNSVRALNCALNFARNLLCTEQCHCTTNSLYI